MATDNAVMLAESPAELRAELIRSERAVQVLTARIRLLEAENASLVEMLEHHGLKARTVSDISLELPPPLTEPLDADAPSLQMLNEKEVELLLELCGDEQAFLLLRSNTMVDAGEWLRKRHLWVCATGKELVVFTAGSKAFAEKLPVSSLQRSIYNHVTGELVLAPAGGAEVKKIKLAPADAYQLLSQIYQNANPED